MRSTIILAFLLSIAVPGLGQYSTVGTYAGTTTSGLVDGPLSSARFHGPYGLCMDRSTGTMYVADTHNNSIRKIQDGTVSTLAGNGTIDDQDGQGVNAHFYYPGAVDFHDGYVYVCDNGNHKIKRIDAAGNVVTIAGTGSPGSNDGAALSASFFNPVEVRVTAAGVIYVCDYGNHTVRKIENGVVSTVAGMPGQPGDQLGVGTAARFNRPSGLAFDDEGNIYVTDQQNHKIKRIDPDGTVTLLAGSGTAASVDGTGAGASFNQPTFMTWDPSGALIVADAVGNRIRRVMLNGGTSTIAGSVAGHVDGPVANAEFDTPMGLCGDDAGNLYVGDKLNNCIRVVYKSGNEPQGISEQVMVLPITVHPDPAQDRIELDVSGLQDAEVTVRIMDIAGRCVRSMEHMRTNGPTFEMAVDGLVPGEYHLLLRSGQQYYRAAFVRQ